MNTILQRDGVSISGCEKLTFSLSDQEWLPRADCVQTPAQAGGHASLRSTLCLLAMEWLEGLWHSIKYSYAIFIPF